MKSILIYGAGGHAKAVIDVIEKAGECRVTGLLDRIKPPGTNVYGYQVLGNENDLAVDESVQGLIVAIGDNWLRAEVAMAIRSIRPDLPFITAIHPNASVARGAEIGEGSVVMAGAVVNSDTRIGKHCILYTLASVDHDSSVGDFVSFAPHAATGGGVSIGAYTALGIGAKIIHSVSIGEHTVVGAGANVLSPIADYSVAYGTPAREIRARKAGERYL
ncbi:acetyltransferase [Cohnella soli]|uniref:Acetyltransferase n=1 Tax=Cohnella soli TaxID=425005 RepID=A0ABW0I1Q4_9BACL